MTEMPSGQPQVVTPGRLFGPAPTHVTVQPAQRGPGAPPVVVLLIESVNGVFAFPFEPEVADQVAAMLGESAQRCRGASRLIVPQVDVSGLGALRNGNGRP